MGRDVQLGCRCGQVGGSLRDASPAAVNRVVCYCADCQAFLHHLGRPDLLDAHGGSDIVQVAPSSMAYDRGTSNIVALRLSPKGLYRFYASCCKTPLGNTVGPSIPFVGIVTEAFAGAPDARARDQVFGPSLGGIYAKYAIGDVSGAAQKVGFGLFVRSVKRVLGWKVGGKSWPQPFFDRGAPEPRYPVTVVTPAEREAARSRCGPHPSAAPSR